MENSIDILCYEKTGINGGAISSVAREASRICVAASFTNCDTIENDVLFYQPDVIILDIDVPGWNDGRVIPVIKNASPETQVLIVARGGKEEDIFYSIKQGASGYLCKNASPSEITEAIEVVHSGGTLLAPDIARKLIEHLQPRVNPLTFQLSVREIEILEGLVKGLSYKLIAYSLKIKIDTVRSHIRNIYAKLNVNSKTEAILKAIDNNLVNLAEKN